VGVDAHGLVLLLFLLLYGHSLLEVWLGVVFNQSVLLGDQVVGGRVDLVLRL
jgi:hypothetical protein